MTELRFRAEKIDTITTGSIQTMIQYTRDRGDCRNIFWFFFRFGETNLLVLGDELLELVLVGTGKLAQQGLVLVVLEGGNTTNGLGVLEVLKAEKKKVHH
jgi:hypothetical protein